MECRIACVLALMVLGNIGCPQAFGGQRKSARLAESLEEPIDMKDFQLPMTLKEALGKFYEVFEAKGKELPILIDTNAFKEESPDAPDVYDTQVKFAPFPKIMPLSAAVLVALSQIPTNNATYLIKGTHVEITTFAKANPEHLLGLRVTARFHNRTLADALDELADQTGATILVDNRLAEKVKATVSTPFRTMVTLESALGLLVEMADLRLEVQPDVFYITSRQNAPRTRSSELLLRNRRIDVALREFAQWADTSIVVDPEIRPATFYEPRVTATFKANVNPEAAVRTLAHQAGLSVAVLDNVYFVSTRDKVEKLQAEFQRKGDVGGKHKGHASPGKS